MAKNRRQKTNPQKTEPVLRNPATSWFRIVRLVLVCGIIAYLVYRQQQEQQPAPPPLPDRPQVQVEEAPPKKSDSPENASPEDVSSPPESTPSSGTETRPGGASRGIRPLVENMTIRDRDGDVVYRGPVDLSETIARIQRDEKLRQFDHDGITFQNRERRLPKQPAGYYREWVHPTPELRGPGPQRVVTGDGGDFWYTPDHYRSFHSLNQDRPHE